MGIAEQLIDTLLGSSEAKPFDLGEHAANIAGSSSKPEFGSAAGGLAGSAIGAFLGGPIGSTIGGAIGSKAGEAASQAGGVPMGPGATIESGTVDTTAHQTPVQDGAITTAQALQSMAVRGLKQHKPSDGRGKTF